MVHAEATRTRTSGTSGGPVTAVQARADCGLLLGDLRELLRRVGTRQGAAGQDRESVCRLLPLLMTINLEAFRTNLTHGDFGLVLGALGRRLSVLPERLSVAPFCARLESLRWQLTDEPDVWAVSAERAGGRLVRQS